MKSPHIRTAVLFACGLMTILMGPFIAPLPSAVAADIGANCSAPQAKIILNGSQQGAIESAGDVDVFSLSVPAQQWIGVFLVNLPGDYGVEVRTTSNRVVASGNSVSGTGFERTFVKLSGGTYCIRVFGKGAASSANPYTISTMAMGNDLKLINYTAGSTSHEFRLIGEIFNGSAQPRTKISVQMALKDLNGTVLEYKTVGPDDNAVVQPGNTIGFYNGIWKNSATSFSFPQNPIGSASMCAAGAKGIRMAGVTNTRQYGSHLYTAVAINDTSDSRSLFYSLNQYDASGRIISASSTGRESVNAGSMQLFSRETVALSNANRWIGSFTQHCW